MTYDEMVAECKKLRSKYRRAESEYFLFLMRTERELGELWRGAGHSTFESFLRSNDLSDWDEYAKFVRGVRSIGEKSAVTVGAAIMIAAGDMAESMPNAPAKMLERAKAFATVNHTPPSPSLVKEWKREVSREERPAPPSIVTRATELMQLRARVKALEAENAQLRARVAQLEGKGQAAE